jgi:aspartate/methionine/tyrosine aminotransferase
VPVKVDGATKEFGLFGGRVGFVTFPFAPDDPASVALESKVKGLTRAVVGSPVSLGQILLLEALRTGGIEQQVEAVRRTVGRRYEVLRRSLAGADPGLLTPLPFNSGCFALVELAEELGLEAEAVRRHLLERHDTGLISIAPRYLRIAYCSVDEERLPELVARLERGVRELAGR